MSATVIGGSAVVAELIDAGHEVVGLARSGEAAAAVSSAGASVQRGSLEDVDSVRKGAASADGVIHTVFIHDFSRMGDAAQTDLRAIEAFGDALQGSDRPLVITTGTALIKPGQVVTEEDRPRMEPPSHPRMGAEPMTIGFAQRGVRSSIVRPGRRCTARVTTGSSRS